MSALERLKACIDDPQCGCGFVCGAPQVSVADLRELIASAESREAALHAETERGNALAVRVDDAEARFGMADETVATLRAELAGAQSQAAAAIRERDDLRRYIHEQSRDGQGRVSMPLAGVAKINEARNRAEKAEAALAAAALTVSRPRAHADETWFAACECEACVRRRGMDDLLTRLKARGPSRFVSVEKVRELTAKALDRVPRITLPDNDPNYGKAVEAEDVSRAMNALLAEVAT